MQKTFIEMNHHTVIYESKQVALCAHYIQYGSLGYVFTGLTKLVYFFPSLASGKGQVANLQLTLNNKKNKIKKNVLEEQTCGIVAA